MPFYILEYINFFFYVNILTFFKKKVKLLF